MGLSIVVRMESYSCNDRTDNADDATERKCVRVVSPARESETDMRIRKLEEHLERQNQEIKRLKTSANNVFVHISKVIIVVLWSMAVPTAYRLAVWDLAVWESIAMAVFIRGRLVFPRDPEPRSECARRLAAHCSGDTWCFTAVFSWPATAAGWWRITWSRDT